LNIQDLFKQLDSSEKVFIYVSQLIELTLVSGSSYFTHKRFTFDQS